MDVRQELKNSRAAIGQNRPDLALRLLKKVISVNPENAEAWLLLADVVDNPAHAEQALQRVLQLDPDNFAAQIHLDRLRRRAESPNEVEADVLLEKESDISIYREEIQEEARRSFAQPESEPELTPAIFLPPDELIEDESAVEPLPDPEGSHVEAQRQEQRVERSKQPKPRQSRPKPAQSQTTAKKRGKRWLEIGLIGLIVICVVCIIITLLLPPELFQFPF